MRTILFLICLGLLWAGGQEIYTAATNREPTVISAADYLKDRPEASWLRLTGCQVDVVEAVYFSKLGVTKPSELFIPVRPAGAEGGPINILLQTKDTALIDLMNDESSDEDEVVRLIAEQANRDIEGVVQFGINVKSKEKNKLAENVEGLASDFVIIREGIKPNFGGALGIFGGGVLVGGLLLFTGKKKSASPLPPGVPPPTPPQG